MSEINVVARTQKIIVDPPSRSVAVINSGPMGPAGPPSSGAGVTLEEVLDALGTALVPGANITITPNDALNTITIASTASGGVGGATVSVQPSAPSPLVANSLWIDEDDFATYVIYNNAGILVPVEISRPGGVSGGGYSEGYLTDPNGTDDYLTIQSSLSNNIRTILGPGVWRADGLVIPPGHTLTSLSDSTGMTYDNSSLTVIRARDGSVSEWVVEYDNTPLSGAAAASGSALTHLGIHGNSICKGVHVLGLRQVLRDVHIHMTSEEGLVMLAQSCYVEKVTVTDTFNSGAPTVQTGSAVIGGADNVVRDCEFSGLPDGFGGAYYGGLWSACHVTTGNSFFSDCVGEFADNGFYIPLEGIFNRFVNCRADKNWGHGFNLDNAAYQQFAACTAHDNSRGTPETFDQWHVYNTVNSHFAACDAFATWPDDARYAFYDNDTTGSNKYAACGAANGWALAEFGGGAPFDPVETLKSTVFCVNVHGSNANAARIPGYAGNIWYGTVQPVNMVTPDIVIRTDEAVI